MTNKIKNVVVFILALVFILFTVSCASKDENAAKKIEKSDKTFLLNCYATPYQDHTGGEVPYENHPEQNTLANWENIKKCGFNYALPVYDVNHEHILNTLENAQKVGIKVFVMDHVQGGLPSLVQRAGGKNYAEVYQLIKENEQDIIKRYDIYKSYDSFAGIHLFDEPSMDFYEAINAAYDWWYEHYSDYELYTNLLPSYSSSYQLYGAKEGNNLTFSDYIVEFVEAANPAFISYDYYPFIRNGFGANIRQTYLSDLEVVAEAAQKYDIPYYCFQLCIGHLSYTAPTTYREYAWQVYTALAYGCSGFQTFRYWPHLTAEVNSLNISDALVSRDGAIKPLYYAVQEVNKELVSMQSLYFNFDWEGVLLIGSSGGGAYSNLQNPLKKLMGVSTVKSTGDTIIGQFKDKSDNYAYMVVNYTSPYVNQKVTTTINFENTNKVLVCKKGRQVVYSLEDNVLELEIGSGEGYFVIPIV